MNSSNNNYQGYWLSMTAAQQQQQQQNSQATWSTWTLEQQQHYAQYNYSYPPPPIVHPGSVASVTAQPPLPPPQHSPNSTAPRSHNHQQYYQNNNSRQHFNNKRRFNNNSQQSGYQTNNYQSYQSPGNQSWQRVNGYKKMRVDNPNLSNENSSEIKGKVSKKKKKPLSQNVPSRKEWSVEDAKKVIELEKEHNKRLKNHSLIIKFPDLELNRDIVTGYHKDIENVHFQQPSTPRFCFVTLQESANPEAVIEHLNKIKFGDGYLSAEFKKDRDEDQIIAPEDIDPLTLYVGNLVQTVTKEDMVKAFPKCRRIDIGYAKKMKYTRYAFVSFNNISDSIEAFKNTHSMQMYSKSLIVRFRRLHGTVGMPGESNTQNINNNKRTENAGSDLIVEAALNSPSTSNTSSRDVSVSEDNHPDQLADSSVVKKELLDEDEFETKPRINKEMSKYLTDSFELALAQHRPIVLKQEVKEEPQSKDDCPEETGAKENGIKIKKDAPLVEEIEPHVVLPVATIKTEPEYNDEEDDDELGDISSDEEIDDINFGSVLDSMLSQRKEICSLRKSVP